MHLGRLALAAPALLVLVLTACGEEEAAPAASDPTADPVPAELVLTAGGEDLVLDAPVVGCRESESTPGAQVLMLFAGELPGDGGSGFYVFLPGDELEPATLELPTDGTDEEQVVFAFAAGNETSGSEEDSTGSLEILDAGCDIGDRVRGRVDVRLGSEFGDGDPIDVSGGFDVEVTDLTEVFGDDDAG